MNLSERLSAVARCLVDQNAAHVIVPPQRNGPGYWFGGGNLAQRSDGTLWLVGRYRNHGDSRTGLGAGERGLELALFRSDDGGKRFEKALQFTKSDLNVADQQVLSIEGSALRFLGQKVELYVSTEKTGIAYPPDLQSYLKPGTGVWTIDRLQADSIEALASAHVQPVLASSDPRFLHVKDPFLATHRGEDCLLFCSHPFSWTSSNTGFVPLSAEPHWNAAANFDFFPRGFTWDVAMTRGTAVLPLPQVGVLAGRSVSLVFYDGGECVRNLDPHAAAVPRPRGYSCEELGGAAWIENDDLTSVQRLSITEPMFVSPHGTGCSRYVDVLATDDRYYVTWQQAQPDGSQPLVMNVVPRQQIEQLLKSLP